MDKIIVILSIYLSFLHLSISCNGENLNLDRESMISMFAYGAHKESTIEKINQHLEYLDKYQQKESAEKFVKRLFFKTQSTFLNHYSQYSSFSSIVDKKQYDCVTGTALYSIILSHYGFKHQIVELDFHVYILLQMDENEILIESTNPQNGLVTDAIMIDQAKKEYRNSSVDMAKFSKISEMVFETTISLKELAGLHFYNLAVNEFNSGEFDKAKKYLTAAKNLYDCKKVEGLLEITQINLSKSVTMR